MKKLLTLLILFTLCIVMTACTSVSEKAKILAVDSDLSDKQAQNLIDACTSIGIYGDSIQIITTDNRCEFIFTRDENYTEYKEVTMYADFDGDKVERIDKGGEIPYFENGEAMRKAYDIEVNTTEREVLNIELAAILGQYIEFVGITPEHINNGDWTIHHSDDIYTMISDNFTYGGETNYISAFFDWTGLSGSNPSGLKLGSLKINGVIVDYDGVL